MRFRLRDLSGHSVVLLNVQMDSLDLAAGLLWLMPQVVVVPVRPR